MERKTSWIYYQVISIIVRSRKIFLDADQQENPLILSLVHVVFFALTMNGWQLHYLQKRTPRLLENSAFFIYHNILFQEDLYSFRRSNCSMKRLLHSNFALFNQILPVSRSFVDVYFSERFWQVSTRQQLRAKWLVNNFWPSLHCYWWESISIFPSHLMINRAVILIICSTSLCLQRKNRSCMTNVFVVSHKALEMIKDTDVFRYWFCWWTRMFKYVTMLCILIVTHILRSTFCGLNHLINLVW